MRAAYVAGVSLESLLDPGSKSWGQARPEVVAMIGTPLGLQPTPAIQVAWAGKQIGAVTRVDVSALHDGTSLALRLEWEDSTESQMIDDTTAFSDGAAVLFPVVAGAPLLTMGAPGLGVNAWYWRADTNGGRQVVAEGIGTSRTTDETLVNTHGIWKGGRWSVVIARAFKVETTAPVVELKAGATTQFGVAVWEGSHQERGGVKAFSGEWRELTLDAPTTARR